MAPTLHYWGLFKIWRPCSTKLPQSCSVCSVSIGIVNVYESVHHSLYHKPLYEFTPGLLWELALYISK